MKKRELRKLLQKRKQKYVEDINAGTVKVPKINYKETKTKKQTTRKKKKED